VDGVPRFERFWIGGDTLGPRIFETRTVTPRRFVYFCRGVAVDLEDCGSDELGQILDVERDPVGLDVTKYDQNLDGILDERDLVELGGDRFYLLQAELVYPLNETFELALFVDVGNSLFEDQNWGFEDVRISTGIEMRFILPVFPAPLRLIYGIPLQETALDSTSNFTFAIGRSF
jgi:outer membrane protein assembly factor BamA